MHVVSNVYGKHKHLARIVRQLRPVALDRKSQAGYNCKCCPNTVTNPLADDVSRNENASSKHPASTVNSEISTITNIKLLKLSVTCILFGSQAAS